MTIYHEGLEDRVEIEVEHECQCDCQREPEAKPNSTNCNQRGTYECGVCHCNEGWSGDSCQCDQRGTEAEACGTEAGRMYSYASVQYNHVLPSAVSVNLRQAESQSLFRGRFIKLSRDLVLAERYAVTLESARAGNVFVLRDIVGIDVNVTIIFVLPIIVAYVATICSDRGVCECGKCRCDEGFRGTMCEECHACPGSCEANYNCIECVSFKQGIYNDTMCKERCHNINTVPLLYYEAISENFKTG
uniref:Integrin beta-3 n=1 Tax=Magallana gigas TaxID=29159 RepID=K1RY28_MAGGI